MTEILHEVAALEKLINTRLEAMDKAIALLQTFADKSPTTSAVAQQVESLKDLTDEKFKSVAQQFSERDTAVGAALQAAKEAVGEQNKSSALSIAKSEAATTKQIDLIGASIGSTTGALNDKIDDLKMRLTAMEGRGQGMGASGMILFMVVSSLVSIAAVAVTILLRH